MAAQTRHTAAPVRPVEGVDGVELRRDVDPYNAQGDRTGCTCFGWFLRPAVAGRRSVGGGSANTGTRSGSGFRHLRSGLEGDGASLCACREVDHEERQNTDG